MRGRFWKYGLLALVLLFFGFIWVMPLAMEIGAEKWIRSKGIPVEVEDIDFNPFTGRFTLFPTHAGSDDAHLRINRFELQLKLVPFLKRHIQLSEIFLEGLSLQVRRDPGGRITILGLALPEAPEEAREAQPSPVLWGVEFSRISLSDIRVSFSDTGEEHLLFIKEAQLGPFHSGQPEGETQFEISGTADGGSFNLGGKFSIPAGTPSFSGRLRLAAFPLSKVQSYLEELDVTAMAGFAETDLAFEGSLTAAEDALSLDMSGRIRVTDFNITGVPGIPGVRLAWSGLETDTRLHFVQLPESSPDVTVDTSLRIEELLVEDVSPVLARLSLARTRIDGLKFDETTLALSSLSLEKISVRGRSSGAAGSLTYEGSIGILKAEGTRLNRSSLAADVTSIVLTDFLGAVTRPPQSSTEPIPPGTQVVPPASEAEEAPRPAINIGSIEVGGSSRLTWKDEAVQPSVEIPVPIESLRAGPLALSGTDADVPFDVNVGIGEHGKLQAASHITGKPGAMGFQTKGQLKSFDLTALNAYAARGIGYSIKSGHADADWQIKRTPEEIQGETFTRLTRFDMEAAAAGSDQFTKLFGMPAGVALSMLRDGDGDIELRIPIEGDPSSPDFGYGSVLAKATGRAIRKGAISYFAPMGVTLLTGVVLPPGSMLLLGKALDWTLTLRFDPVLFEPGTTELNPEAMAYLDTVGKLLGDRPKARLLFCGFATPADLFSEEAAVPDTETTGAGVEERAAAPENEGSLTEENVSLLLKLAEERSRKVMAYLVNERGISPDRLYLCQPEVEHSAGARARVEVSG